jgi:hypothetical protein
MDCWLLLAVGREDSCLWAMLEPNLHFAVQCCLLLSVVFCCFTFHTNLLGGK